MTSIYDGGVNPNQEGGFLGSLMGPLLGPFIGQMGKGRGGRKRKRQHTQRGGIFGLTGLGMNKGLSLARMFNPLPTGLKRVQSGGARTARNRKVKIKNVGDLFKAAHIPGYAKDLSRAAGPSNEMGLNAIAAAPTRTMMISKPAGRRQKYNRGFSDARKRINTLGKNLQKRGTPVASQFMSKELLARPNKEINAWLRQNTYEDAVPLVRMDDDEEDARPSTSRASTSGGKTRRRQVSTPPKPPTPVRGRVLGLENKNLTIVLKALGLLTRKDGFQDKRHKYMGWFLHGENAGNPRPGRRAHLSRQAFILAQLMFQKG